MTLSSRAAFRDELKVLAESDLNIIDVEADLGGHDNPFKIAHPERYFNMGIAESASLDICAGLAKTGLKPVFSSFAPFIVNRASENLKLNMGYMHLPIILAAEYGGASGGWFGTTHQSLEDLAYVRSIPGIRVACPYGEKETRKVLRKAVASKQPWYIRLGRNETFENLATEHEGAASYWATPVESNSTICLVSSGEVATDFVKKITEKLPNLAHLHVIESDIKAFQEVVQQLENVDIPIVFVEEHRFFGSIGMMAKSLLINHAINFFGVNDKWPVYGGTHYEVLNYLEFSVGKLQAFVERLENDHD